MIVYARQHERRDAPVVLVGPGVAARADGQAEIRLQDFEDRVQVLRHARRCGWAADRVRRCACRKLACDESTSPSRFCSQLQSWMRLETLRCSSGTSVHSSSGISGLQLGRAHVDPDHAAFVDGLVGGLLDLLGEPAAGRLVGHVHAGAVGVELPAVVDAAQALFLVATPEQVGVAVRAPGVQDGGAAAGGPEGDQVLAQQLQPDRGAVRLGQLFGEQRGQPVAAEELAHGRARARRG